MNLRKLEENKMNAADDHGLTLENEAFLEGDT